MNIVIADAQPIFRSGLRQLLEMIPRFNIVGESSNGKALLKLITDSKPDVAILSIDLPDMDGFEIARKVFSHSVPIELIFLTSNKSKSAFNTALNLGVKGYVLKECSSSYLIDAVNEVSNGKSFVCPQLSDLLINRNRRRKSFIQTTPKITDLTPSEKRILVLISHFMTSKEIAAELFISVRTVEHHRENIARKLNLHGSHCLIKFAVDHQYELN